MNWNRAISAVVAIVYVVLALILRGPVSALEVGIFAVLPLACIWFSEAMGSYTGLGGLAYGYPITKESPAVLVCVLGWIVLLLPIVVGVVAYFLA
ncbi:MAG: hypothetical protein ACXWDN_02950 [Limisphaerales bacterium]